MTLRRFRYGFLIGCLLAISTLATPQEPDWLIFEGKEYPIEQNPIETYFAKHPDKMPNSNRRMSNLWRGYLAFYEFRDKELFLGDLKIYEGFSFNQKSVLVESLGDKKGLKITWYSGLLFARYGKNSHPGPYENIEFRQSYESYAIFEVVAGRLTQARFFDNKGFRTFLAQQFEAFQEDERLQ